MAQRDARFGLPILTKDMSGQPESGKEICDNGGLADIARYRSPSKIWHKPVLKSCKSYANNSFASAYALREFREKGARACTGQPKTV